eukprot:GDKI01003289.1.p1 GENE.GDKI01003289.1~~GDKI01003289.1.p1  ORF type:complete len:378 (+),score=79.07 GDKI01003289.1:64-1197(+)
MKLLQPVEPSYTPEQKAALKKTPLNLWELGAFIACYAATWLLNLSTLALYTADTVDPKTERRELYYFHINAWVLATVWILEAIPFGFTLMNIRRNPEHAHLHFKLKVSAVQLTIVTMIFTSYTLLACDAFPVFIDPVTGRRVYGARFEEWTVAAPMYVYLVGRLLFNAPLARVLPCMGLTAFYLQLGLWAAVSSSPLLRWGCVYVSYVGYFASAVYLASFRQYSGGNLTSVQTPDGKIRTDPNVYIKRFLLSFIIVYWGSYGFVFHAAHINLISSEYEQLAYTCMDSGAKMMTAVCLISLRSAEWDLVLLEARAAAELAKNTANFEYQLHMLKMELEAAAADQRRHADIRTHTQATTTRTATESPPVRQRQSVQAQE